MVQNLYVVLWVERGVREYYSVIRISRRSTTHTTKKITRIHTNARTQVQTSSDSRRKRGVNPVVHGFRFSSLDYSTSLKAQSKDNRFRNLESNAQCVAKTKQHTEKYLVDHVL